MNKKRIAILLIIIIIIFTFLFIKEISSSWGVKRDGEDHFIAKVTSCDKDIIGFEIIDSGSTPYEHGKTYFVRRKNVVSSDIPDLVLWDYIRVECNSENKLQDEDSGQLSVVFAIYKTDISGKMIYD